MSRIKHLRVISLVLVFILAFELIPIHGAAVTKAPLTYSKIADKTTVMKNQEFTLNYKVTPQSIGVNSIPKTGSAKKKEIVIIIDKSWSMEWDISGSIYTSATNPSRLSIVKETAKKFVENIKDVSNVKVALVSYAGTASVHKQSNDNWYSLPDKYTQLNSAIDNIYYANSTNIGDAIRVGKSILDSGDNSAEKYFVLMTDGAPNYYSYTGWLNWEYYYGNSTNTRDYNIYYDNSGALDYAKIMARQLNSSYNRYFIAFADQDAGNKLEEIAKNNGRYEIATSANDLSFIYNEIADQVVSEFSLANVVFKEEITNEFEVVSTSNNLDKHSIANNNSTKLGNINYRLNKAGTHYIADPVEFSVTLKAKKAGTYTIGGNINNSYLRYDDLDGTEGKILFDKTMITVEDYNPLEDSDPRPNEVRIDTDRKEIGINVDWDNSDDKVEYYLLGDLKNSKDNSNDKYFTIDKKTGKITVRDMKKLREDLAKSGMSILQKYISVNTGNSYEYLTGDQEVVLTTEMQNQVGFFQTKTAIDLTKKTEIEFELNLGSRNDFGADGVVFVLNDKAFDVNKDSVSSGGGLGYDKEGNRGMENLFSNSVGFEFDTWINHLLQFKSVTSVNQQDSFSNNKRYDDDHIALVLDGTIAHVYDNVIYKHQGNRTANNAKALDRYSNEVTGSTISQYTPGNLEDGQWRLGKVVWDPDTNRLSLSYDVNANDKINPNEEDLVVYTYDLEVKFPEKVAYFGITAATGTYFNNQKIRNINVKQDNILNVNGNIIVKAVKGDETYYKSFDFDIVTEGKAISEVTRTFNSPINVNQEFNVNYGFTGDKIMLDISNKDHTVPFNNLTFTEQYPPYMDIVSYPEGLEKLGDLETGYILTGVLPNVTLKKEVSTGLYEVDGSVTIRLMPTKVYPELVLLDKGNVSYTDPNNFSQNVVIPADAISIKDNVKPNITIDAKHNNSNPGGPSYILTGLLDGTYTEIVETHFVKASNNNPNMKLDDIKGLINASTSLETNKSPDYINHITNFAPYKNKDDFTFIQTEVYENGYYYLYVKDANGNEAIRLIHIKNLDEFVPIIT